MLRKYETLYILKHDSPPEKTEAARAKIRDVLTAGNVFLVKEDVWGKKKLAFEIKKHSKGIFVLLVYLSEPEHITEIERNLKIHLEVIRYVTVKISDAVDMEAEQAEKIKWDAELGRRAQEQAARGDVPEVEEEEKAEKEEPPFRGGFGGERRRRDLDDDDEEAGDERRRGRDAVDAEDDDDEPPRTDEKSD
jgi:small subunit ribosomal protein S6